MTLAANASDALTGTGDAITENGNNALAAANGGNGLQVNGTGNTAAIGASSINYAERAAAVLTGSASNVTVSGAGTVVNANGQANAVSISSGAVNLAANSTASVTGAANGVTAAGNRCGGDATLDGVPFSTVRRGLTRKPRLRDMKRVNREVVGDRAPMELGHCRRQSRRTLRPSISGGQGPEGVCTLDHLRSTGRNKDDGATAR